MTTAVLERAPDAPVRTRPRNLRKPLVLGAALLIGAGVAWYGYDWWTVGRFIESTDDAYVGGDVTVMAPKVSGFITQVAVADNQPVHEGDLLIRLDDRDYRAALSRAEAMVAGQQATLANLDARRRLQMSVIAETQAGIAAADAETVRTRDDQVRYQALSRTAAASIQSFQKADADYKQAVAGGEKARAALDAAQRQLDVIDTQKQQTQAALDAAIADRDTARLNLGYTELRAPFDGTVGNRSARTGAFAGVGSQLIAIVPARGLWVDANFKENQLAHMQAGEAAEIHADVLPGVTFHGHVASLAPATGAQFSVLPPENATGNFTKIVQRVPVRVLLDDDGSALGRLRPGLSVVADIDLRDSK
ncbi:MAG: HlyD family secretion protein [Rhodopila sp.]|nr:HlyD family secretion protein [Rhodopila sp.]